MSIPATDHPSLTQQARQSAKHSRSMRPRAHALGDQRYREDKPRHQDRHEQKRKAPRGLRAFLHRNEAIKTFQKKANPIRLTASGQFQRTVRRLPMAARLTKKNEPKDTAPQAPSKGKQPEGRFCLQVETKATYATLEAAEAAGLAIKKSHPIVCVGVYDHLEGINKVIQMPES
jgi:hypothetical protein